MHPGGKRPGGAHPCALVILGKKAKSLERRIIEVQIVCKGKIKVGHGFWLEFRGEGLRLDSVFGVPRNYSMREGIEVYEGGFNLSS